MICTIKEGKICHSKYSYDNIIVKIKVFFLNYMFDIINKNFIFGNNHLLKFNRNFKTNLKSKDNLNSIYMKIKDFILEASISKRFSKYDQDHNKKLIEKIYKEGKEIKVIQILELTFKELFIIFRRKLNKKEDEEEIKKIAKKIEGLDLLNSNEHKDITYLINRCSENDGDNEKYINSIKNVCCNYESYFERNI